MVDELLKDVNDLCQQIFANDVNKSDKEYTYSIPHDYRKIVGFVGDRSSGVTTVVTAVSEQYARMGKKTAIIDFTEDSRLYESFGRGFSKLYPQSSEACTRSLGMLAEGRLAPVRIDRFRHAYISRVPASIDRSRYIDVIDLLENEYEIVIFELDFNTNTDIIRYLNSLYIIKDMNLYTLRHTAAYIKKLKQASANLAKIRVILNKYIESPVNPKGIIDSITVFENPDMAGQYEVLIEGTPGYFIVPFDMANYKLSIESMDYPFFNCNEYTPSFKTAIEDIAQSIYPLKQKNTVKSYLKGLFNIGGRKSE